uniref:Uncharacterized protein n=1 Tax=Dunaliella tertiolecta TaxID=3047 RepID=A0A7S3R005_DUNTE
MLHIINLWSLLQFCVQSDRAPRSLPDLALMPCAFGAFVPTNGGVQIQMATAAAVGAAAAAAAASCAAAGAAPIGRSLGGSAQTLLRSRAPPAVQCTWQT